jgi:hypothetical protein
MSKIDELLVAIQRELKRHAFDGYGDFQAQALPTLSSFSSEKVLSLFAEAHI